MNFIAGFDSARKMVLVNLSAGNTHFIKQPSSKELVGGYAKMDFSLQEPLMST